MKKEETIPLLYDHHSHVSGRAAYLDCVDLSEVEEKEKALSLMRENCSKEKLNVVKGWNDSYYSFDIEEVEKMPPVFIWNVSGHGLTFNEKAEKRFKEKFEKPRMVKKMKDPEWVEKNLMKVSKIMMKIEGITGKKIQNTYDFLLERGIYRTDDMLLPSEETLEIVKDLEYQERTKFWADVETFYELSEETRKEIEGVKLFADGALGPKTAAMNGRYLDGNDGVLIYERDELKDTFEIIEKDKVSIHAIGDRAIDMVVGTLAEMEKEGLELPETRIEHAQFISEETAKEAKSLDIKLSMQPNFSIDSVNYSDRLSKKYLESNNPFRMLIDKVGFVPGKDLLFGSDGLPYGVKEALENSLFPNYE
ncbi:MAG: amidohydrolase family protein, partial [Candidatus Thermoplasmatota archaeon]|nr:amidohydrolase family protein [Candidatus Thermoplasmatota archaeon]